VNAQRTLVRVEEMGQVTIPREITEHLGLEAGDLVAVVSTPEGVLITPQAVAALEDLDRIGAALRESGVTLEDWIESGREIRGELYREKYGREPTTEPA
jgi:AbrB family looped-hinge helix DNA binding protein